MFVWLIVTKAIGLSVVAQQFVDDCGSFYDSKSSVYAGFGPVIQDFAQESGWSSCPDRIALKMQSKQASVTYLVSGGETIEVDIYSDGSTLACPAPGNTYAWGLASPALLSDVQRLYYDRAGNSIYLGDSGKTFQLLYTGTTFQFMEVNGAPALSSLPYYGLNVYTSRNGTDFRPLPMSIFQVRSQWQEELSGDHYFERFTASIPSSANYIRVELIGCDTISGYLSAPSRAVPLHALAAVRIDGNVLQVGPKDDGLEEKPADQEAIGTITYITEETKPKKTNTTKKVISSQNGTNFEFYSTYNGNGDRSTTVRLTQETGGTVYYPAAGTAQSQDSALLSAPKIHYNLLDLFERNENTAQRNAAGSAVFLLILAAGVLLTRRRG